MNKVLAGLLLLGSISSFAATQAKIAGAIFNDQEFVETMGSVAIDEIDITMDGKNSYQVVINTNAPLADGCSYSARVTEVLERFAMDRSTTGLRSVLKVSNVSANCPWPRQ